MTWPLLSTGDPAPWFGTRRLGSEKPMRVDRFGGKRIVLALVESLGSEPGRTLLAAARERGDLFDDVRGVFLAVTADAYDEQAVAPGELPPGVIVGADFDQKIAKLYRSTEPDNAPAGPPEPYRAQLLVIDERLQVVRAIPVAAADPRGTFTQAMAALDGLPPIEPPAAAALQAPVLLVSRVFEPEFCRRLMAYYDEHGGIDSGFMRETQEKTIQVIDYDMKRRADREIVDDALREECLARIRDRLVPEIRKAFQFPATRIERYIVACYEAETGGHFRSHRDNTTRGTAHRRFAVSLNLNTGEYDGGQLRFPEFGPRLFTPPMGGAVVFSCSLLHEALPVTRGKRYVFLPFLYDEEAAKVRQANLKFVENSRE